MNKQLNINNNNDFTLMYFNKNFIKKEYHAYKFYRYKIYIYMNKNYDNTLIDKKSLIKILKTYIDNSYYSYSITYDNISKIYTIEYYTD